ncbi:16549_t:CDS:2, partial [Cetraspora pellucida]
DSNNVDSESSTKENENNSCQLKLADDDEQTSYSSYQNNVSACEFIELISCVIEQETFQELHNSD